MTPDQALSVLVQMARRAMATADDHALAQQAATVLRQAIVAEPEELRKAIVTEPEEAAE